MHRFISCLVLFVLIFLLLIHTGILTTLTGNTPLPDFDAYYLLGRALLTGQNPYQVASMQTLGPPLVIAPFLPLAILSIEWGRVVITALNLLATAYSCWLLSAKITGYSRIVTALGLCLLVLSSFPARFSILMGQPNLAVMFFLTMYLLRSRWSVAVGTAAAAVFKTQFVLLALPLLKKRLRLTVVIAGMVGGLVILLLPIIKLEYYQDFATHTLQPLLNADPATGTDYYNQTLGASAARLGLTLQHPMISLVVLVLASLYLYTRSNRMAGIVLSILVAPVAWQHYYVVLFPVFVLVAIKIVRAGFPKIEVSLLLTSLILWWGHLPALHASSTNFVLGLTASHFFLSGVLLLLLLMIQEKKECYTKNNARPATCHPPRT